MEDAKRWLDEAQAHLDRGRWNEALALAEEVVREKPESPFGHLKLAKCCKLAAEEAVRARDAERGGEWYERAEEAFKQAAFAARDANDTGAVVGAGIGLLDVRVRMLGIMPEGEERRRLAEETVRAGRGMARTFSEESEYGQALVSLVSQAEEYASGSASRCRPQSAGAGRDPDLQPFRPPATVMPSRRGRLQEFFERDSWGSAAWKFGSLLYTGWKKVNARHEEELRRTHAAVSAETVPASGWTVCGAQGELGPVKLYPDGGFAIAGGPRFGQGNALKNSLVNGVRVDKSAGEAQVLRLQAEDGQKHELRFERGAWYRRKG